ncbi:MAG: AI-2E family transporter [Bacteroidetes bacterium]|nr:AI-2E family transporter [Bacteroidota bacterium]MCL5024975.1 AI-2E family transporter [Chloroflexota bacterium]
MEGNPWLRVLIILLVIIAGLYLLGEAWSLATRFGDIITLFFLAWLVAFILSPITGLLCEQWKLPRPAAAALVYLALMALVVAAGILVVPIIVSQLAQLGKALPAYAAAFPGWVTSLQNALADLGVNVDLQSLYPGTRTDTLPAQVERIGTFLAQNTLLLATGFASFIFSVLIVLILSFYFMLDGPQMAEKAMSLVPRERHPEVRHFLESVEHSFGGFIRGQVVLALAVGLLTGIVMWMAGLSYVLVVSIYVVIVMIIPFIGPFLALVPPILIALLQLPTPNAVLVAVTVVALQSVVLNVLAPKLMGDVLGIHPLLVFLAMLVGSKIAGVGGAIFGVPVAAVINAMAVFMYRRAMHLPIRPVRQAPPARSGWPAALRTLGTRTVRRLFQR